MIPLPEDGVVAQLDIARTALAEAKTIQETKKILDVASAAEIYAKRQQLGEEAIHYATSIKVEALAQLGRMLKETPRNKGAAGAGINQYTKEVQSQNDTTPTLANLGLDKKTSKLAQDIAELPEEQLEAVKTGVITLAKAFSKAHVSHNSGENEWYTPKPYIEAAREVMGVIDLDPASSEPANRIVEANTFFSHETDGRKQRWFGNVWMNPPYSQPLISEFCDLLVASYKSKTITQACVLVNNATETTFYQNMLKSCVAICLIKGRVKFIDKNGMESGAPLQGQTILYFGENLESFAKQFSQFGVILYAYR